MKLFYGTGNQSKLRNMRAILAGMPIELVTPADLGIRLPAVEETGATPLENAALKAEASALPVQSCPSTCPNPTPISWRRSLRSRRRKGQSRRLSWSC